MLVAAAVTYLLTPLVRRGAFAVGALKVPRSRDVHEKPIPTLGGIAMYGGLAAGLLVTQRLSYLQEAFPSTRYVEGLLLAGALLLVVGFIDDRWGMGAITKLAGQVAAGGVLVWSGVEVPWVPTPGGNLIAFDGLQSETLTIALVVVTINAVNFIDGLDGLAAGVVAVAALSFLIYSYTLDKTIGLPSQSLAAVSSALLTGMCLGFLPHNFNPAKIFMGDTGSMLLGLLLAYGPITSLQNLDPSVLNNYAHLHPLNRFPTIMPLILPAAILIIPFSDMVLAVIRRVRAGKSPWAADKEHLHHRLMNIGHSQRQSVLIMYLWAALFAGTVVALSVMRTGLIWIAITIVGLVLVLLPATMPRLRPGYKREAREREARAIRNERAARVTRARQRADAPTPRGEAPARRGETPSPRGETPAPRGEPAGQRGETPAPTFAPSRRGVPDPFPALEPFPGDDMLPPADPFPPVGLFPTAGAPNGHPAPQQSRWPQGTPSRNGHGSRDHDPAD
jgi:UDP-GlcNAc:undecaprenyl-phosphate GlcNAc-1-phosphate transferase